MKKLAAVLLAGMAMSGCATGGNTLKPEQLQHHRYLLQSVDGKPIKQTQRTPEIGFGENMHVYGSMCNRFMGKGEISGNTLKVEHLAATQMLCVEPELNQLDQTIGQVLAEGAVVTLAPQSLTLKTSQHTLVYKLADLVK